MMKKYLTKIAEEIRNNPRRNFQRNSGFFRNSLTPKKLVEKLLKKYLFKNFSREFAKETPKKILKEFTERTPENIATHKKNSEHIENYM